MFIEEIKLDTIINIPSQEITKQEILEFSASYDPIPLHTDEEYAKTTKFGQLIAPGVLSFLKVWSRFIEQDIFGDELIAGKSTKIEWLKPVFVGDKLSGKIFISNITKRNNYNGIVETTMEVYNQNKELVLTNVTESIVKYKN